MDDVIKLISKEYTKNKYGISVPENSVKEIFCQIHSITRQEFFNAGRNGLNPSFVFTVFFDDYHGEPIVEYKGESYSVYRTYLRKNDKLELYVERKGGTN